MGDRSLNYIDEKFIAAGSFLKKFKSNPSRLDCLKAFTESPAIIEWILTETKGINEIKPLSGITRSR